MSSRLNLAVLLAVVAGLLAAAETVWLVGFLGSSSDGPAFAMALVALVLIPTVLAATGTVLLTSVPRRTRLAAVGAVAAAGLVAAGVEAASSSVTIRQIRHSSTGSRRRPCSRSSRRWCCPVS